MTIFLDIDGVVKNFTKSAFSAHNFEFDGNFPETNEEDFCISKMIGISKKEFWQKIDKLGHEFWEELEDYEHTQELIEVIKEYDNFILLTAPSASCDSEKGKKLAIQKMFGKHFKDYIFTPKKHKRLLAYVPNAVLIDDTPINCKEFIETGGKAILFPEYRNKNRHVTDKVSFVKNELDRIYQKS